MTKEETIESHKRGLHSLRAVWGYTRIIDPEVAGFFQWAAASLAVLSHDNKESKA